MARAHAQPTAAAAPREPESTLHGDEEVLYRRHHVALRRAVARAVQAPDAVIEDACAFAWLQLVRTQPERGPALLGWLRVVAVHEAYRLAGRERREGALEELVASAEEGAGAAGGWEHVLAGGRDLDASMEARAALGALAELPQRQRRYLALLVAGYRYEEIVELTGATYTNVTKNLARARARLRAVAREGGEAFDRAA